MKTNGLLISSITAIAFAGLIFIGCHKDATPTPTNATSADITPAEDDANASYAAYDSKNISDAAVQAQSSSHAPQGEKSQPLDVLYGSCVRVHGNDTVVGGNADTVVYIDFGKGDCFCRDSRNRRGTIIVYWGLQHPGETWLQAYFDSSNTITETFENYYLKENGIAGVRTWTNEGHNTNGYQNWTFTADLTITYPNGQTATWTATRNNAIADVSGTWYYEINGNAKGVARDGMAYTVNITSPIYLTVLPWWAGGCPWPESGIVSITRTSPAGGTTNITINYGTLGTCSGTKTVTINGTSTSLVMW